MALGLGGDALGLPRSVVVRLPWIEDGEESPDCGWQEIESALKRALLKRISAHVREGGDLASLLDSLRGWPIPDLVAEFETVKAWRALEKASG